MHMFERKNISFAVLVFAALLGSALSISCYTGSGSIYFRSGNLQACSNAVTHCHYYFVRVAGIPYYYKGCGTCSPTVTDCTQCTGKDGCNSAQKGVQLSTGALLTTTLGMAVWAMGRVLRDL